MEITHGQGTSSYEAPGHFGMVALQPHDGAGSGLTDVTVGLSHVAPGGGYAIGFYGRPRLRDVTAPLGALESCFVPAGEERAAKNRSGATASMLVLTRTGGEGPSR
jgi:hypothetical protein